MRPPLTPALSQGRGSQLSCPGRFGTGPRYARPSPQPSPRGEGASNRATSLDRAWVSPCIWPEPSPTGWGPGDCGRINGGIEELATKFRGQHESRRAAITGSLSPAGEGWGEGPLHQRQLESRRAANYRLPLPAGEGWGEGPLDQLPTIPASPGTTSYWPPLPAGEGWGEGRLNETFTAN